MPRRPNKGKPDPLQDKPVLFQRRQMINGYNALRGGVAMAVQNVLSVRENPLSTFHTKCQADVVLNALDNLLDEMRTKDDSKLPAKPAKAEIKK